DGGPAGPVSPGAGPGPGQPHTGPARAPAPGSQGLPPGVIPALDLVRAPGELHAAVAGLLAGVVVAGDLAQARELLRTRPELRVGTRDGDLLGTHRAHGGSGKPPSMLAMRAAAEAWAAGRARAGRAPHADGS